MQSLEEDKISSMCEIGTQIVDYAEKIGADQAEAYVFQKKGYVLEFSEFSFNLKKVLVQGVGVQVELRGALGFSSTSTFRRENYKEAIKNAIKITRIKKPDANWHSFAKYKKPKKVYGTYDHRITDIHSNKLIEYANEIVRGVTDSGDRVNVVGGGVSALTVEFNVANSLNLNEKDIGTTLTGTVEVKTSEDEILQAGSGFGERRNLSLNFYEIGKEGALNAINMIGAKQIKTLTCPVIFEPSAAGSLFSTLSESFNALNVFQKRSIYEGMIGKEIASEKVTLIDDGLMCGGLNTRCIDDEGIPQEKTKLVDHGFLLSYLYNSYAAHQNDIESNGKARRVTSRGITPFIREPYEVLPHIGFTNLVIGKTTNKSDQILEEVKLGVLVRKYMGNINPTSTDFNINLSNAYLIQDGEVKHPIKGMMISDSMNNVLKRIIAIGDDHRQVRNIFSRENFFVPTIVVDEITITGK